MVAKTKLTVAEEILKIKYLTPLQPDKSIREILHHVATVALIGHLRRRSAGHASDVCPFNNPDFYLCQRRSKTWSPMPYF